MSVMYSRVDNHMIKILKRITILCPGVDTLLTKVSDALKGIAKECRFSNLYTTLEKYRESLGHMESKLIASASELLHDWRRDSCKRRE